MSPRPGSGATVDYSTLGDPDQPAHSQQSGLAQETTDNIKHSEVSTFRWFKKKNV